MGGGFQLNVARILIFYFFLPFLGVQSTIFGKKIPKNHDFGVFFCI